MSRAEDASFGTVEFLERAIDCWGDDVLRLANSTLGNRADAEDVFQTVFLRLFSSGKRFADDEHVKAWLLRVTVNCCKDELRGARRRRVVPLGMVFMTPAMSAMPTVPMTPAMPVTLVAEGPPSDSIDGSGDGTDSDDVGTSDDGATERLREALTELPAKQRTALHLFYQDGCSTEEIAAIMEENPSTVRSHLHRARQSLRTKLGEHDA